MNSQFESTASLEQPLSILALPGETSRHEQSVERLRFKLFDPESTRIAGDTAPDSTTTVTAIEEQDALRYDQARHALEENRHSKAVEDARHKGREDGRRDASEAYHSQLSQERNHILACSTQFAEQKAIYFAAAETQLVQLALAIAKRILHREVLLDPLLLRGVVRIVLEKLEEESGTILRVPESALDAWRNQFEEAAIVHVELQGSASLQTGECTLETRLGRIELGIAAQLEEVEKGFFDLLQKRPVG